VHNEKKLSIEDAGVTAPKTHINACTVANILAVVS